MQFLHFLLVATAVGGNVAAMSGDDLQTQPHRVLRAATKRSDMYRRSVRIMKRFETEMAYVDNENIWSDASTFASQVKVGSQKPVLNLEEHEHHLQDVKCDKDAMQLHFVDVSSARDAQAACHDETGGLIITSHESCNEEGERSVYRVNDVSFAEDGKALEVSVVKTTWREAFDHVNITFGHTTDNHFYRRHADFARIRGKRQNRVNVPQNTPDNVNTAIFDLNSEVLDKTFATTDFLDIIGAVAPIPDLPVNIPIELGCKRCATTGQLTLSQGAFNIDLSQIDLIPDIFQGGDDGKEISKVITGGFMELAATGVGARLELFARPSSSGAFEVALFQLPIAGFTIPGIGQAGAVFEPRVNFAFNVTGGLEVNYGLDLKVPDGSSIRVELTNLGNSKLTGFQDTRLTPLPVTVNITDVDILLSLAFKPSIPVGFEFLDQLKAEVAATLELPRLDAKLSSNVAENCGNGSNATTPSGPPYKNSTTQLSPDLLKLGPIALVEANVSLSCDLSFDVSLPVLPPPFNAVSVKQNIFTALFPLVSECASPRSAFDNASGLVIPPPPTSASSSTMSLVNTTATAVPATSMLNYTTSSIVVWNTTATSTSVSSSTPSFQNVSASVTSATSASYTAPSYLNTTAGCSTSSGLNTTTTLASSTELASSSIKLNTTTSSYVISTMSTPYGNTSTTVVTATSFNTSQIALTTATPTANATTLDPGFSFSLFSPTHRSRASSTEATSTTEDSSTSTSSSETSTPIEATSTKEKSSTSSSETNTSIEATSLQESSSASTSFLETNTLTETTSTTENSSIFTSASSYTLSASTSPEDFAASSNSAISSIAVSSTSASSAPSTSISLSQPAVSPSLVIPAPSPFPTVLQSLAATLSETPGFLIPTNASALPIVQTSVEAFTGVAARDVQSPLITTVLGMILGLLGIWII